MRSINDWGRAAERNPFGTFFKVIILLMFCGFGFSVVGHVFGWFGEAATVAREEFGPRALLEKYEWFKDASASADAKLASIKAFKARESALIDTFGPNATEYPRDIRMELAQIRTEVAGAIASYNLLAADYNAAMAKFNYRFTNVGDLPAGATEPLPREFKPYREN